MAKTPQPLPLCVSDYFIAISSRLLLQLTACQCRETSHGAGPGEGDALPAQAEDPPPRPAQSECIRMCSLLRDSLCARTYSHEKLASIDENDRILAKVGDFGLSQVFSLSVLELPAFSLNRAGGDGRGHSRDPRELALDGSALHIHISHSNLRQMI